MLIQLLKLLWARWKTLAHMFATFQSRMLLFIFYFVVLPPFALAMRLASDPLRLRSGTPAAWLPRLAPDDEVTLSARRQF